MAQITQTRVLRTMDDILFGDTPNTALYSDLDEYEEAQQLFKNAEIGKEFSGTVYWQKWLKPSLETDYKQASTDRLAYTGNDVEKNFKLNQRLACAKYALQHLAGMVEDAETFPRPVFSKVTE